MGEPLVKAITHEPADGDVDMSLTHQLAISWFDPIEHAVRDRVRSFIEELIESELATVLARSRYGRRAQDGSVANSAGVVGHRRGSRTRTLAGTFGRTEIAVPRARLMQPDGGTTAIAREMAAFLWAIGHEVQPSSVA